jgi:hypothetical protein
VLLDGARRRLLLRAAARAELCGIEQMNAQILCVVNSKSRQIGNIIAEGVTCGIFVLLMCVLLLVVVLKVM